MLSMSTNSWSRNLGKVYTWLLKPRNKIFFYLLYFAPFIIYELFIMTYGVNVFYWDEVDTIIGLLKDYVNHSLSLASLWQQHNEHRIFFPSMIEVVILSLTHANVKAEMYFSSFLILGVAIILLLYGAVFRKINPIFFLPVPFILFDPIQWENSLWGFQLIFFLVIFSFVVSISFLHLSISSKSTFIVPSILFASIGSFSALQGLLTWLIGGIAIIITLKSQRTTRIFLIGVFWILSTLASFYLYFHGWHHPGYHPSILYPISHPRQSATYFLASVGNSLGANLTISCVFGIILLLGYSLALKRTLLHRELFFPACLILFALLFDAMITFGRSGFGPGQALSSRYTSFNLLGIAGLYIILIDYLFQIQDTKATIFSRAGTILFFFIFIGISYFHGVKNSAEAYVFRFAAHETAIHYRTAPPHLIKVQINPSLSAVMRQFSFLEKQKWSVFKH